MVASPARQRIKTRAWGFPGTVHGDHHLVLVQWNNRGTTDGWLMPKPPRPTATNAANESPPPNPTTRRARHGIGECFLVTAHHACPNEWPTCVVWAFARVPLFRLGSPDRAPRPP